MATNRHTSCGALEVKDVEWTDHKLTGVSKDSMLISIKASKYLNVAEQIIWNHLKESNSRDQIKPQISKS